MKEDFYLPTDKLEMKITMATDLDKLLAKHGIITFHNLLIDNGLLELDNGKSNFHISIPFSLTDMQKDLLESWFGIYNNGNIDDISYEELGQILHNKTK